MAGSFNHLVDEDGGFSIALVENRRDCVEELAECWDLILYLGGGKNRINAALKKLGYPQISRDKHGPLKPSRIERRSDGSLKVLRPGEKHA